MKILFVCTAHNSLSQRLYLALSRFHDVSIEYALSDEAIIEAANLTRPDLVICPFLTARVPEEVYLNYLTLIVHPGPPGDAGPSAIDWLLMGDDGTESDVQQKLGGGPLSDKGRSHWGVTILQAIAEFDAGPVWAFEQFEVDIDEPGLTKSTLYRGPVTRAALSATLAAVERIQAEASRIASSNSPLPSPGLSKFPSIIRPGLQADPAFRYTSVHQMKPFLGGTTHSRPLLKAAQREFDVEKDAAKEISRRIRSADSQPGCQSKVFGPSLYIYGGLIDESEEVAANAANARPGQIVARRDGAVCIATCDKKGIWITHVRRLKRKGDPMLWPKVPSASGLQELGVLDTCSFVGAEPSALPSNWSKSLANTFQEIYVDYQTLDEDKRVAFVHFDFYNGAMSTEQCSRLVDALEDVIKSHTNDGPLNAVVLMGGDSYFSNGIALNVIEAASDSSLESWLNINRIDDIVDCLLKDMASRNILTIAAVRGNCAAGGVALAAACDIVITGSDVVLNPAYRALGLHGSEYHSVSYSGRCGPEVARGLLRDMVPISPYQARSMGLVDHVLPGSGRTLDRRIHNHIKAVVRSGKTTLPVPWKSTLDLSPSALARARATELGEMAKDFWSPRSERYHLRRRNFVRKIKAKETPLRFATHRRTGEMLDEEELDEFDSIEYFTQRANTTSTITTTKETPAPTKSEGCPQVLEISEKVELNLSEPPVLKEPKQDSTISASLPILYPCYYDPQPMQLSCQ
ncbi:formyl transferase [Xylariales sp. PMI_506]|nr:formyl transferase [Xylariales sp. PMI_506]